MTSPGRAVAAYLDHLTAEVGASAHTVAGYRRDLGRYVDHLAELGIEDIRAVTPEHVRAFAAGLRAGSAG
ncbi:MAG: site-specific integrase, partial [Propionibacteriaceae bacterium]|nr:site-specific integrase [Propionibacteriaceae bacterium]